MVVLILLSGGSVWGYEFAPALLLCFVFAMVLILCCACGGCFFRMALLSVSDF